MPTTTWLKVSLKNQRNQSQTWLIYTGLPYITKISAYLINLEEQRQLITLNKNNIFRDRPIKEGQILIPIELKANENITLYIKYKTNSNVPIALEVFTEYLWKDYFIKDNL
jgi:hypothetical protein